MRSSLAVAASMVLILGACGGGESAGTTTRPDAGTTVPSSTSIPDTTPDTTPDALGLEVGKAGVTAFERYDRLRVTAAAELRNTSASFVEVSSWRAELLDAGGAVVADTSAFFAGAVAPGQTVWLVPTFVLEDGTDEPTSMRVEVLEARVVDVENLANGPMPVGAAPVEQVSAVAFLDINDEMHVEAVFRNDGDARLTNLYVGCGLYVDDEPIAGAYGFISEILPGGSAAIDTTSALGNIDPLPTDIRCAANTVNTSTYEPGATGSGLEVTAGMTFNPAGGQGNFYDTIVGVTLYNPTDKAAFGVHIDVDLLDAEGNIVHLATPSETYVLPGETLHTGIRSIMGRDSEPPVSAVARTRVEAWGDPTAASLGSQDGLDLTAYPFEFGGLAAQMSTGLLVFVGTVTNRSAADLEDAVISCVALRSGVPTGGASWTLGSTPTGVATSFEIISGFSAVPPGDTVRCNVHLTAITKVMP